MQKPVPVLATHKLIVLIVFICAALMMSLFIYHMRQKPITPLLAEEIGTVFSVSRDIKSFKLVTADEKPFTEKDFYQHWTLLFFGFTHCASICPTTLEVISRAFPALHAQFPDLRVVLVSVDPERDNPAALHSYLKSWQPDFMGVTGKIQEIRKLQSQLGVYAARDTSRGDNYQIQHTASILLIDPAGKWKGLLRFGLTPDALIKAVQTVISGR